MKKIGKFEIILMVVLVGVLVAFIVPNSVTINRSLAIKSVLPSIIQDVKGSVVHIVNESRQVQGSGVAVTGDIIVTARHVVDGGVDFTITTDNGMRFKASKAISSKDYDVGFIKLGLDNVLKPAKFGSVLDCELGQPVFVIGSPYGKLNFNSVTLGIVSGLDRNYNFTNPRTGKKYGWQVAFTTDAAGHPGNSGCPIFTMDGKVRGVIVGGVIPVLIVCMPTDLFIRDIGLIERMFGEDKYYIEESPTFNDGIEWGGYNQKFYEEQKCR